MWPLIIVASVVGLAITVYMALRLAPMQVLGLYDRALRNHRDRLERPHELPVYAEADLAATWPGWDGWYVLLVPQGPAVPAKAIRVSIMTGLYGLDGIDHYAELQGLSPFEAVEYLMMIQTDSTSRLFRRYLPKQTDLAIRRDQLLVVVKDWGEIGGEWPQYRIQMQAPEADMALSLTYTGKHLLWWADFPHVFTYVAAFGELQGTLTLDGQDYAVTGLGSFEHGFARKPFNFDALLRPLRVLQRLWPVTLMHYHYNLLIGDDGVHGGMMLAQGLGIDFRNLGGIYFPDGRFIRLTEIQVDYLEIETPQDQPQSSAIAMPKKWLVRATAETGSVEYTATRLSPPAVIATHMVYGDFQFVGRYRAPGSDDVVVSGHGYNEFVRI